MPNQPFKNLLKNPNFLKLWSSQLLSQLTINLVNFLIIARIFEATKSTLAISLLWVAWCVPALIFGPVAGAVVDSFSRRRMMIATNFLQALSIAFYFIVSRNVYALYIIVFLYSAFDQFYSPAQQSSVPWLVKKELLPAANGIFLLTQQASLLAGFGLGGIFLALFGTNVAIALAAAYLLLATLAVYLLPPDQLPKRKFLADLDVFWKELRRGFEFVKDQPPVWLPLLLIIGSQVFVTIVGVILPAFIRKSLDMEFSRATLLLIIPGGLGALTTTYFLPRVLPLMRKMTVIQVGLLLGGLALGLFALLPLLPVPKVILAVPIAICLGVSIAAVTIPAQTLLQEKTPEWFRGRVYGSLGFLMTIATAIPVLLSAALTDLLGSGTLLGILAVLILAGFVFTRSKGNHVMANGLGV